MGDKLKPYDGYKETDLYWLGNIPNHWKLLRIKKILSERKEKNTPVKTDFILSLTAKKGVIPYSEKGSGGNKAKEDLSQYNLAYPGDLIINCMNVVAGSVGISQYYGAISPVYYALYGLDKDINIHYYNYIFQLKSFQKSLIGLGNGILMKETESGNLNTIRMRISMAKLNNVMLSVPKREEQDQIVRYLDWKLAKVYKFIKAKKKQVELLKEQKQVIINDAVTKGIDLYVSLKESGIKCAGLIPKHWNSYQLGKVAKIILSGLDKKSYEGQQSILLCNYVDVYKNENITDVLPFMKATASEAELTTLKLCKDDVIITKDSESWDDIGVPAYVSQEIENLYCGYHLAVLRTNKSLVFGEYLYNAFRSQYVQIQHKVKAKGVTRFALGYQPIHDTVLLIPPIEEQKAIVEKIRIDCSIQDTFIIKLKKEIELLLEYKTSLISDVVTGKVDVRDIIVEDTSDIIEVTEELDETEEVSSM